MEMHSKDRAEVALEAEVPIAMSLYEFHRFWCLVKFIRPSGRYQFVAGELHGASPTTRIC